MPRIHLINSPYSVEPNMKSRTPSLHTLRVNRDVLWSGTKSTVVYNYVKRACSTFLLHKNIAWWSHKDKRKIVTGINGKSRIMHFISKSLAPRTEEPVKVLRASKPCWLLFDTISGRCTRVQDSFWKRIL